MTGWTRHVRVILCICGDHVVVAIHADTARITVPVLAEGLAGNTLLVDVATANVGVAVA